MRIAIVAPGGVGGYFGGLLARSGETVLALARGAHLAAIQTHGLRVEGPGIDETVRFEVSDNAASLGVADIVLFAVKLFQIEQAARDAAPLFGPRTVGISLLNGIGGAEAAASVLPGATVLGGVAWVSAVIAAPGHIRTNSAMSSIEFGAPESEAARTAVRDFAERCRRAGFAAEMVGDVRGALWNKLIGLASNAALTSAARLPAGPLYTDPDVVEVATALVAEATAVARAQGVACRRTSSRPGSAASGIFRRACMPRCTTTSPKAGRSNLRASPATSSARAAASASRRRTTLPSMPC